MRNGYNVLAEVYDELNQTVDYPKIVSYYEECFKKYSEIPVSSVLDLGCGTGTVTLEMAKRGYDLVGVDSNEDMLATAQGKALEASVSDVLWLEQSMTELDLYGTVSATVSCLDCINHLLTGKEVEKCFSLVHLFLEPGGLFIFDVNTPTKFENVYKERDYVLESDGTLCAWHNEWHPKTKICDFQLTVFREQPDGLYERTDGLEREKCYSKKDLVSKLEKVGFEVIGCFDDCSFNEGNELSERWHFVAKARK